MSDHDQLPVNNGSRVGFGHSFPDKQYSVARSQNQHQLSSYKQLSVKSFNQSVNIQQLLKFFAAYRPQSSLSIEEIHKSPQLKLKRYKQCIYYGQFLNDKKHGKGIMVYHNGRVYQGEWQSDIKYGNGYQKFVNYAKYQGSYVNGKPEGVGKYMWPNGQLYQGQWINGLKHGSGMWRGARGDSYIGQWKFGKADGYGVHTWLNGDRYEGEFKACLKHGQGTQKFANGDIYVGGYINGKPSGYGQYYWKNGSFFKGNFKNGLRHGNGVWKRSAGVSDKYQGQYANDKKCGYGIFTWASGNVYKGNYFDDFRHGYGEMYWNDNSCYKGMWQKGIQHGQGQITLPGQFPKKGMFQQNVLIQIFDKKKSTQENLIQNEQNQEQEDMEQIYAKQQIINNKKVRSRNGQEADRVSQKSYYFKNRFKDIDSKSHYSNKYIDPNHKIPVRPPHLNPMIRESSNRPSQHFSRIDMKSAKEKIPHSSFYLHQINKNQRPNTRDITRVNNGRGLNDTFLEQGNQKYRSRRIQTGNQGNNKRQNTEQQIKDFVQSRISRNRNNSKNYRD